LRVGHAWELQAVINAMLGVDHAMRLHRDHDGHAQTDAEKAEQWRQGQSPILGRLGGIEQRRNDRVVAGGPKVS
jgi:hypothetical protein